MVVMSHHNNRVSTSLYDAKFTVFRASSWSHKWLWEIIVLFDSTCNNMTSKYAMKSQETLAWYCCTTIYKQISSVCAFLTKQLYDKYLLIWQQQTPAYLQCVLKAQKSKFVTVIITWHINIRPAVVVNIKLRALLQVAAFTSRFY